MCVCVCMIVCGCSAFPIPYPLILHFSIGCVHQVTCINLISTHYVRKLLWIVELRDEKLSVQKRTYTPTLTPLILVSLVFSFFNVLFELCLGIHYKVYIAYHFYLFSPLWMNYLNSA